MAVDGVLNFRDQLVAAPLKRRANPEKENSRRNFRDQLVAAPLKLAVAASAAPVPPLFPRPIGRGPIEALVQLVLVLVHLHFRDQLVAAPLKLCSIILMENLHFYFRDQLVAAPLKQYVYSISGTTNCISATNWSRPH